MRFNSSLASALRLPVVFAACALLTTAAAHAAPQTFDFKDPKGVNNIQFNLDAPLEAITGTANGVSGSVSFDPAAPATTTGRIVLEAKSLTVGNSMMLDHLQGAKWLDVAQYPTIVFEASKLSNVRTQGAQILADLTGKLTLKGITKELTVPVTFTYLADKLGARLNDEKIKGDLLVLRSTFAINRSEFNIMAGQATEKVSESIQLSLAIAGAAPRK
ncbi:MAG: YceI family protein [Opitutus sp.]|nr:YceI family protein [Opitutus sp.]MCS6247423.1 YceI family protein [Opitutus sp.]MCS6275531.1 YceI family protein [Opitutus sp.]MCS6276718.1 YceI family protein [Opitutus sp.]MCS6301633.1 YceI family protein [Opitutus sp.]